MTSKLKHDSSNSHPGNLHKLLTQHNNSISKSKIMEVSTSPEKQPKAQPPKGRILKEKRAKLYIIRRCIVMLLCWKENGDQ
ncbi:hypothetical protein RJT34_02759 [Clitoria ternatea]|uniref:Uncharacterized protein n=1 Tax=Clitoria ternatea TaxID=43366 RepID=A0AAN9KJI2_CLITE